MKKYKTKGPVPHTCNWCLKHFPNTKSYTTHLKQTGDKNCIKPAKLSTNKPQ